MRSTCIWYLWLLIKDIWDITDIQRDIMSDKLFNRVIKEAILTQPNFFLSMIYTRLNLSEKNVNWPKHAFCTELLNLSLFDTMLKNLDTNNLLHHVKTHISNWSDISMSYLVLISVEVQCNILLYWHWATASTHYWSSCNLEPKDRCKSLVQSQSFSLC